MEIKCDIIINYLSHKKNTYFSHQILRGRNRRWQSVWTDSPSSLTIIMSITWMDCIRFSHVIGIADSGRWGIMWMVYRVSSKWCWIMHRQSDTDVTMTLLAWLVSHTLSAMTTLRHTERRFVFLLSILSFKWPMCNSQGNLTELDDNFSAIGIAATTLLSSKAFLWCPWTISGLLLNKQLLQ